MPLPDPRKVGTWDSPASRRERQHGGSPGPHRSRGWVLALTSVAFFMVALDALVVVTALPDHPP